LMSVQGVPKYGAGLYIHSMPLGSNGLLGMVGVFGLCVALLAVITCFLDRYPNADVFMTEIRQWRQGKTKAVSA